MISTLYVNNYLGKHSSKSMVAGDKSGTDTKVVYSCQAIITSTLLGHCLGHSDLNTVLISSAIRIAQCMGLDKQSKLGSGVHSWPDQVSHETTRQVWWQLCIQDYFAVAFANTYSKFSRPRFRYLTLTHVSSHPAEPTLHASAIKLR